MTRIDVVGLGPAGVDLVTEETRRLLGSGAPVLLRTRRHPAAELVPEASTFDERYEEATTFEEVYASIVERLVDEATLAGSIVYAVPGSPVVAERTVQLLRTHPAVVGGGVEVVLHAALSFVELAMTRLGLDPVAAGVRLVDGAAFALSAAGERGPLLVAQCWESAVLSEIKLAVEVAPSAPVTVLHHLGLPDEQIFEVEWSELDRTFTPDHLTTLWIPELAAPVAQELMALEELVRTLRARCPWDQAQTHGSLARHLLEESYEVLEALDAVAALDEGEEVPGDGDPVADLEEELGDLLFQVYFHALLGAEAGRFTLADVARGVHDKLELRHPHVFGGADALSAEEVSATWEVRKLAEKQRSSVTEGIPAALPALALMAKLQRKGEAVGLAAPELDALVRTGGELLARVEAADPEVVADLLSWAVGVGRVLGIDPETALRRRAAEARRRIDALG